MRFVNDCNLHPVVFRALQKDGYNAGKSDATATSLIKPPRIRILERRHWQDVVIPASKRKGAFLGTVIHKVLELAEVQNTIKEQRLYAEIDGWIVSAQYDLLTLDSSTLTDWKSMLVWKYQKEKIEDFEKQLNMQAWLLAHGQDEKGNRVAYHVEQIEAVALLLDWSDKKARLDPKYPQSWSPRIPLTLWPYPKTEAWIRERVKLHKEAEALADDALPHCTAEERWQEEAVWAVVKEGGTRAIKGGVCSSKAQAEALLKPGLTLQERPSEPIRCMSWCLAASHCSQYKATIPAGLEAMTL